MVEWMVLMVNARSFYFVFYRPFDFTRVYHLYEMVFNAVGYDRKKQEDGRAKIS
jgi:hypothetical protein